eukprot:TRINITY_DN720_c0_g1_i2.p1 TRINITY_DN720_c0_g1~~TRINITY_DN720_c0_g1_i2.p1  ORF type:complete len:506 (+),score=87.65 TRINITY_DN720_c0_g1_i2:65-1582(+)
MIADYSPDIVSPDRVFLAIQNVTLSSQKNKVAQAEPELESRLNLIIGYCEHLKWKALRLLLTGAHGLLQELKTILKRIKKVRNAKESPPESGWDPVNSDLKPMITNVVTWLMGLIGPGTDLRPVVEALQLATLKGEDGVAMNVTADKFYAHRNTMPSAMKDIKTNTPQFDVDETNEGLESLDAVVQAHGKSFLIHDLITQAQKLDVPVREPVVTPFVNSIPTAAKEPYPGDEGKIANIVPWNSAVMVSDGNASNHGLGGHIDSHFLRGKASGCDEGDSIYIQGHVSPGAYSRAFLEGRISLDLLNFRTECHGEGLYYGSHVVSHTLASGLSTALSRSLMDSGDGDRMMRRSSVQPPLAARRGVCPVTSFAVDDAFFERRVSRSASLCDVGTANMREPSSSWLVHFAGDGWVQSDSLFNAVVTTFINLLENRGDPYCIETDDIIKILDILNLSLFSKVVNTTFINLHENRGGPYCSGTDYIVTILGWGRDILNLSHFNKVVNTTFI